MVEVEADDALASAAVAATRDERVEQVIVARRQGPPAIRARHPNRAVKSAYTCRSRGDRGATEVWCAPTSIPDYLALVGDAGDGFPCLSG